MEVRDWIIIIFTFFVGMLSGAYLYVTAYNPIYNERVGRENAEATDGGYSVVGEQYGGMVANYVHPSFRVAEGGAYTFFPGGAERGSRRDGELPPSLQRMLDSVIVSTDLELLATPVEDKNCVSYVDGIEYAYTIETGTGEYELDTCTTAFSNGTDLGKVLVRVWEYVEMGSGAETTEADFSVRNMPVEDGQPGFWGGFSEYIRNGFRDAGFDTNY